MNRQLANATISGLLAFSSLIGCPAQESQRQVDVAKRGREVMPFSHSATKHIFTKNTDGGTMRIVSNDASDLPQIQMVRTHLKDMQSRFQNGDYSGPSAIHGADMPGLALLKAAKIGDIIVSYLQIEGGAELHYRTSNSKLVSALHEWIDAQVEDHGSDAVAAP